MKRQKQIDESRRMIASAFARLMQEHDYEDLTLSQIAEEARVNRMTLYRHFGNKEKIILYRAQKFLDEAQAQTRGKDEPMRELICRSLENMRNLPQLAVLLQNRDIEALLDEFRIASHRSKLEEFVGRRFEDDPYLFHFYFGGVNRIIREWLSNGCRESNQEIADKIVSLTRSFAAAVR
jgi:AcrR family transcriptional regulator